MLKNCTIKIHNCIVSIFNNYAFQLILVRGGGGGGGAISCFYRFGITVPCLMDHDRTDFYTDFLLLQLKQSTYLFVEYLINVSNVHADSRSSLNM